MSIIKKIILFQYWAQNLILSFFSKILFNKKNFKNVRKTIIFRTGSLGDSVCALPAIYTIRRNFTDAKIDILTNQSSKDLISIKAIIDNKIINEVINYLEINYIKLYKLLKDRQYDLFIELPQYDAVWYRQLRNIFFAKAIGAKFAFGWQVNSTQFLSTYQAKFVEFDNERDRLLKILVKNGLKSYGLVYPLGITIEIKNKVYELLQQKGLVDINKNIGIVVGAKRPQNRWPIEYFKEVAEFLFKKNKNILIFGGSEDIKLAEQIQGKSVFNFCGELLPLETAEMMKYCSLIISNDTGPMHLAYAVGTPLIAIFSSRDYPNKWYPPLKGKNIVLRNYNIFCRKCYFNEVNDNRCLKEIEPYLVVKEIKKNIACTKSN